LSEADNYGLFVILGSSFAASRYVML
jgi:hypothetical protein